MGSNVRAPQFDDSVSAKIKACSERNNGLLGEVPWKKLDPFRNQKSH